MLSIFQLQLTDDPFSIESVDQIVSYCMKAEQNATTVCSVKGKSMSRYILHRFIVYIFVAHPSAKENLSYFLSLSLYSQLFLKPEGKYVSVLTAQSIHFQCQYHRIQARFYFLHRLRLADHSPIAVQIDGLFCMWRAYAL